MFQRRYSQACSKQAEITLSSVATADLHLNGAPSPVPFIPQIRRPAVTRAESSIKEEK
jgi:hypothetical protein